MNPSTTPRLPLSSRRDAFLTTLNAPVEIASLVVFRIGFGLILAFWSLDYLTSGLVRKLYVLPKFHFTYYLFDFVKPWPGNGMYLHFLALCVLATCLSLGFLYRVATVLFACGFTYFFLLERTNYQNHYYLLCLLTWVLACIPLNRAASLDVLADLVRPSPVVPTWCLWLVRFHVALPYLFGGIAKLQPDWFAGEPLRSHLRLVAHGGVPLVGPYLTAEWLVQTFIWGGLIFDLTVVPLLLWRRTRGFASVLCIVFHILNSILFSIHVFPWLMIFATTIFFEPDWPRRLCRGRHLTLPAATALTWRSLSPKAKVLGLLLSTYCLFQMTWPLRHYFYEGDPNWTERGHYFSWRMMLRAKVSAPRYYITDTRTGETRIASLRPYVTEEQVSKFTRDPEMVLQLAHHLAWDHQQKTGHPAEVRALILTSLNGRKPELLIDPNVDLAAEPLGFHLRNWIRPQTEPLRKVAWSVPLLEWERHVTLPPLVFERPQPRLVRSVQH